MRCRAGSCNWRLKEGGIEKEKDKRSKERLKNLQKELAELRSEADAKRAQWEAEKMPLKRCRPSGKSWKESGMTSKSPNGTMTSIARRNCGTANCPSLNGD